ncbi:adenosylcobalamin-dependent ribonucleoside-diphosphate reductase [Methanohalophilus sp. WG1-DM]|uniref:adenosylcobalamin-dependent ribonucleoside-diphosphate reductase n=1 Tax=Methanohalophilus sp. WG1-DM TaxID=2491675 RepID=UPI0010282A04|nr:adenosylcobalamin-dependent ribonucleoside-diphosphate reductase [Methanohalophilus sp. WG1-DM]RXG34808.1 ribonucleoside-diphosphate reductase alpha chain [Methanohalophilus sp. WG1-DM]
MDKEDKAIESKLSANGKTLLEKRYLLRDAKGKVAEKPDELFRRVAKAIARVDSSYGYSVEKTEDNFYQVMADLEFLPNSPTLMNAGTELGQLSACFVLPVEDSLKSIFKSLQDMSLIHQSGGGTGFSFSDLRPEGDPVRSTEGVASGPLSFMTIFDKATDVIKQGGRRRGANMGVLRVDHPDICKFIGAKEKEDMLRNFNLSVGVTDEFMEAVSQDRDYALVNPRTGKVEKRLKARDVFDRIMTCACQTGDPGLLFLDEINRKHPLSAIGTIESTNPCGEVPLLPYESCNLGSINLARMVKEGAIDWQKLQKTVHTGVHFLDNVIDANKYPLPQIEQRTKQNRKIGLGVMGFAAMLARLGIPYDCEEGITTAEEVMKFIRQEAVQKSVELGEQRGSFPNLPRSTLARDYPAMRNATVNTVAPTGSLSIIANTTSGIEPMFALTYRRNVMGTRLTEIDPVFEEMARKHGFYSTQLMEEVAETGSLQNSPNIPENTRRVFATALEIQPQWHVRMQAAFQKHVDNAVAKTVNLPHEATEEAFREIYMLAYRLKCKGIAAYRYGSKAEQVLEIGGTGKKRDDSTATVKACTKNGCE